MRKAEHNVLPRHKCHFPLTLTTHSNEEFGRGRTLSPPLHDCHVSRAARESSGATSEKQPTLRGALLLRLRAPLLSLPAAHRRKKGHCTLSLFSVVLTSHSHHLSLHSKVHGTTGREGGARSCGSVTLVCCDKIAKLFILQVGIGTPQRTDHKSNGVPVPRQKG